MKNWWINYQATHDMSNKSSEYNWHILVILYKICFIGNFIDQTEILIQKLYLSAMKQ